MGEYWSFKVMSVYDLIYGMRSCQLVCPNKFMFIGISCQPVFDLICRMKSCLRDEVII